MFKANVRDGAPPLLNVMYKVPTIIRMEFFFTFTKNTDCCIKLLTLRRYGLVICIFYFELNVSMFTTHPVPFDDLLNLLIDASSLYLFVIHTDIFL